VVGSTFLEVNNQLSSRTSQNADSNASGNSNENSPGDSSQNPGTDNPTDASSNSNPESEEPLESPDSLEASADNTAPAAEDYRARALRPFEIPLAAWLILGSVGALALIGGLTVYLIYRKHREDEFSLLRKEERMKRLRDSGISADEFNAVLEQKRSTYTSRRKGRRRDRFKFR